MYPCSTANASASYFWRLAVQKPRATSEAALKIRLKDFTPVAPLNQEPRTGLSMGGHTEYHRQILRHYPRSTGSTGPESHQKMAKAYERGFFNDMITPYLGLERDNNLRTDTNMEKLARLRPAFDKTEGTLTAGNSSPLTDGASCILWPPKSGPSSRVCPFWPTLPTPNWPPSSTWRKSTDCCLRRCMPATRMLQKAGLSLQDFDFYEIHEAFAGRYWPRSKFGKVPELRQRIWPRQNPWAPLTAANSTSTAAAWPPAILAATGGMYWLRLPNCSTKKARRGLISVCAAGGQGITIILKNRIKDFDLAIFDGPAAHSGVVLEGRFGLGWIGALTPEQLEFAGQLIRHRGNVQRLAGLSWNVACQHRPGAPRRDRRRPRRRPPAGRAAPEDGRTPPRATRPSILDLLDSGEADFEDRPPSSGWTRCERPGWPTPAPEYGYADLAN